jgi:hypothetical protein
MKSHKKYLILNGPIELNAFRRVAHYPVYLLEEEFFGPSIVGFDYV